VARAAWLMQPGLILLECVVEVGLLPEINDTLAQLASGLGFGLQTIELALEETVAMPPPTVVGSDHFALLEDQLELNGVELHAFHEPSFGLEDRVLQTNGVAPTLQAILPASGQSSAYTIERKEATEPTGSVKLVLVKLVSEGMTWQTLLYSGSFLFEAFWRPRLQVAPGRFYDDHDGCWFPDSRIWDDVTLVDLPVLTSAGPLDSGVFYQQPQDDISSPQLQRAIDGLALIPSGPDQVLLSVAHTQVLVQAPLHLPSSVLNRCQWLVFHGVFHSCSHWPLFSCIRARDKVEVHYFDGVIHLLDHEMRAVGEWAGRLWNIHTVEVIFARVIMQPQPHLSAAVALAHLRQACTLLSAPSSADLEQWHEWLMAPIQDDDQLMKLDVIPAAEGVDPLAMARFAEHLMAEADGTVLLMPVLYSVALGHGHEDDASEFLRDKL
ncbi:unnamed protein product, partial [Durusdinium trenchii]